MKKRLLAALLIMCLALTLLPAYALADNTGTDPESPEEGETTGAKGPFWVSFDPQGGVVTVPSMQTNSEGRLEILPTAFRTGYTFVGWYDIIGWLITKDYVFEDDTILYARWRLTDGGAATGTAYAINNPRTNRGKIVSSCDTAVWGTTVTLTVMPDSGYELESLKVTDRFGAEVELTQTGDDEYSFKMPASVVVVHASFSKIGVPVQPGLPFTDVSSDAWYHDAVFYVYEKGMMSGTGAGSFSPEAETSRAMIVTVLHRLEGAPSAGGAEFTDVAAGQWYTEAVAWAAENGVVYGSNNAFKPDDSVTREQVAAILYRYAGYKGSDTTARAELSDYSDASDISGYALEAMQWANAQGLIKGSSGRLNPGGKATRAEIAAILMRFCGS